MTVSEPTTKMPLNPPSNTNIKQLPSKSSELTSSDQHQKTATCPAMSFPVACAFSFACLEPLYDRSIDSVAPR